MPARQRTNFPGTVRRQAWARADLKCEGLLPYGERCGADLEAGRYVFDHVVTDFHGGRATLDNCQVLCRECDRAKTSADQATIADTRRAYDAHHRLRAPRKPMDGGRYSPLTQSPGGPTRDRATGAVLSRPGSIDVREL